MNNSGKIVEVSSIKLEELKVMNVEKVLHMVEGGGENSYANNSRLQEKAIIETKALVQKAIRQICKSLLLEKLVAADLGCASGPNTLLVLSEIINDVDEYCSQSNQHKPEIQFFMNDLPSNDFNNLFQLLLRFEKQIREEKGEEFVPFYAVGLPGSFYRRLFPSKSVHFFYSSYCLMWLSQIPKGLEEDGYQLNRTNIYINKDGSSMTSHLYLKQFKKDFSDFFKSRSKELVFGGRMVLSFLGRRDCQSIGGHLHLCGLLAEALNSMVSEGLVEEDKLNTFYIPVYTPLMEEVTSTIDMEGSFNLDQVYTFESNWDPFDEANDDFVEDKNSSGKNVAKYMRSILESLIASHFGNDIMEDLFSRYANNVARHMSIGKPKFLVFVLFLKLKDEGKVICV